MCHDYCSSLNKHAKAILHDKKSNLHYLIKWQYFPCLSPKFIFLMVHILHEHYMLIWALLDDI